MGQSHVHCKACCADEKSIAEHEIKLADEEELHENSEVVEIGSPRSRTPLTRSPGADSIEKSDGVPAAEKGSNEEHGDGPGDQDVALGHSKPNPLDQPVLAEEVVAEECVVTDKVSTTEEEGPVWSMSAHSYIQALEAAVGLGIGRDAESEPQQTQEVMSHLEDCYCREALCAQRFHTALKEIEEAFRRETQQCNRQGCSFPVSAAGGNKFCCNTCKRNGGHGPACSQYLPIYAKELCRDCGADVGEGEEFVHPGGPPLIGEVQFAMTALRTAAKEQHIKAASLFNQVGGRGLTAGLHQRLSWKCDFIREVFGEAESAQTSVPARTSLNSSHGVHASGARGSSSPMGEGSPSSSGPLRRWAPHSPLRHAKPDKKTETHGWSLSTSKNPTRNIWLRRSGDYLTGVLEVRLDAPVFKVAALLNEVDLLGKWAPWAKNPELVHDMRGDIACSGDYAQKIFMLPFALPWPISTVIELLAYAFVSDVLEERGAVVGCVQSVFGTEWWGHKLPPATENIRLNTRALSFVMKPSLDLAHTKLTLVTKTLLPPLNSMLEAAIGVLQRKALGLVADRWSCICKDFDSSPWAPRVQEDKAQFYDWVKRITSEHVSRLLQENREERPQASH